MPVTLKVKYILLPAAALILFEAPQLGAASEYSPNAIQQRHGPERIAMSQINRMNRVHRRSNIWMNVTNWGYFGNSYEIFSDAVDDPCKAGEWAPEVEYPGGSGVQYLFMGALWLGAMIRAEGYEYPRVSVGADGWLFPPVNEFNPGSGATNSQTNGIIERTTLPLDFDCLGNYIGSFRDSAVSEQDFIGSYTDTLSEDFWVNDDPIDGHHVPLGIEITQKSYAWTYNYARNFIIIDWEIENIAGNYLKNLYVGLLMDDGVGRRDNYNRHIDDICGFQQWYYYTRPDGELDSSVINTAWVADNDGRHQNVSAGSEFEAPAVLGCRVLRAPNPKLRTSFNWWIANGDPDLDFGPSWVEDGAPGGWTNTYGTPMGDIRKYFILSNTEFDYDEVWTNNPDYIRTHPQVVRDRWNPDVILETHHWKVPGETDDTPPALVNDLANGYDERYLLSWGPLGIFDHLDETGARIYRLNPGERFSMTIAIVIGDDFHNRNNPQVDNEIINPALFDFTSLRYNADWAARVYDNPMVDTPIYDWGDDHIPGSNDWNGSEGDGVKETGDGWFGEDTGEDGLFALCIGDPCYRWQGGVRLEFTYPGADPDGSENDGHLSPSEDALERPENLDYTRLNGMLDFGDGCPDFRGPPPPPAPFLKQVTSTTVINHGTAVQLTINKQFLMDKVVLSWDQLPSQDPNYKDPFSHDNDFEGYRIYVSNTNLERDFAFLDEFDRTDYAYFGAADSLASRPVEDITGLAPDTLLKGQWLYLKPVGNNIDFIGHEDLLIDSTADSTNWRYFYILRDAHPMIPKYYAVTAYDYGDYRTGTPPLESAKTANAIYVAPSGSDEHKVQVVPNPYRANADYCRQHGGISWENRDDGTPEFFQQTDRRIYFYNLPKTCLIRIYTVAGDLVDIVPHNVNGDNNLSWAADFAEYWDLNSRNKQQVVSGMYLFSVEDLTPGKRGQIQTGKFIVIR